MLQRTTVAPLSFAALLAGTACGGDIEGDRGSCPGEQQVLLISGAVELGVQDKSLASRDEARVLLSVDESSSIVRCADGLVTESHPGLVIGSAALEAPGAFELAVERTVFYEHTTSLLWLRGLLDLNGNGVCDEGELTGSAAIHAPEGDDGERALQEPIVLEDQGCPARL